MISPKNIEYKKQITFKTLMLQSDLYDYSDAYIVVKGIISAVGEDKSDRKNRS